MAGIGPGKNGGSLPQFTEEQITTGLLALVAWAGNASAASRYVKSEKKLQISPATLNNWKTVHAARLDELREKHRGEMEARLAHEMRDVAMLAVETEKLAIEQAQKRLKKGEDQDPGRTAANLARVGQSNVDKLMTLTSRPVQITENRGWQESVRVLAALGVVKMPAIEQATEVPDSVANNE